MSAEPSAPNCDGDVNFDVSKDLGMLRALIDAARYG
jgi:hypothetical protein